MFSDQTPHKISPDHAQGNLWFILGKPLTKRPIQMFFLFGSYFFIFLKFKDPKGFNKKALLVLFQLLFLIIYMMGDIIGCETEI